MSIMKDNRQSVAQQGEIPQYSNTVTTSGQGSESLQATAITLRGLKVRIGDAELLHGVDLDIVRGETTAIVGESGSGKSLTAKALAGLLPRYAHVQGSYSLLGETVDLAGGERAWRALRGGSIVWLPQDPFSSLDPLHTCGVQIAAGMRHIPHAQRRERVAALLTDVGLDASVADRYPHELSGGMRQRVAIAAALAPKPQVLIADEPTTALDAQMQSGVLDLLGRLRDERRLTLVLITHDLALAAERADHVAVFRDGRVVEAGSRNDIIEHPRTAYTRELLAAHAGIGETEQVKRGSVVVRAEHLVKRFAGAARPAVDDVSLDVHAGEILGLVGASGSGKSTVARCLVDLERPDSGDVRYADGKGGTTGWSMHVAQLVFQNPYQSLNPTMTVRQTLAEALRAAGEQADDAHIRHLLDVVGLETEYLNRKPGTLSGGQCQRVAIARALAPKPKLLVADEAVTALDANVQRHVLETLLSLREHTDLAILFISHDLDTVRRIADRIAVMVDGRIIEEGVTAEVMDHPKHEYTRKLIASVPQELSFDALPPLDAANTAETSGTADADAAANDTATDTDDDTDDAANDTSVNRARHTPATDPTNAEEPR